jgi:pilus assembly protein CpaF
MAPTIGEWLSQDAVHKVRASHPIRYADALRSPDVPPIWERRVATGLAIVEDEVRELVRRRGIDPVAEPAAVRRLIDDVISDYLDRAVTSALPPLGDVTQLARSVLDAVAGFGPLQPFLDDPSIEEIWINEPGRVFIARRGRSELTTLILTADQVAELVERMLRTSGRRLDLSHPFVDSMLPDGSRLHVVIPQITREHMAVNIRKFVLGLHSLDELVAVGSLTDQAARFLEACVAAGLNILVSGGTQAGKTTLLNALCAAIPARERIVTVEEVFELQVALPDVVSMQTRQANLEGTGDIPLRRLVKEALRMRPSRLIVGEVRQEECLDLVRSQLLISGLPSCHGHEATHDDHPHRQPGSDVPADQPRPRGARSRRRTAARGRRRAGGQARAPGGR